MTDIFSGCRDRLTAEQVAKFYGLEFDRRGKNARCIFHSPDKHPSVSFKGGRFQCWSCGANGTAIDLAMKIFNVPALEAVRRLDCDFNLGLSLDRHHTPAERKKAVQEVQRRQELTSTYQRFEAWRNATLNELSACFRAAHLALKEGRDMTDSEALAVREQARVEFLADALLTGDMAEQMSIFRERKVVDALCNKILSGMQTKSKVV